MDKGLVHIYCGDGKGKTTAAVGLGMRAIGNDYKVIMIQFLKCGDSGECKIIREIEPRFNVFNFEKKRGFTWELNDEEKAELKSEIGNALMFATKVMNTRQCDLLILDEVLNALSLGFITEEQMCEIIDNKPDEIELVLTGRDAPESIKERADYISKIELIKHPYEEGIDARRGIEY